MIDAKIQMLLFWTFFFLSCMVVNAQTRVEKIGENWVLKVDETPFEVKGVTLGYDKEVANFDHYFEDLQFLGVNTIRIWGTNEHTTALLDAAHAHNIKVMVGIWMRHGRSGMEGDDNFNYVEDEAGKEDMYQGALQVVEQYKNHPAVLTWGLGNEVYLNIATDEEKRAYSLLLERIGRKIKELDSNHPITSVEAWTFGMDWWQELVPSIDIYGLNSYGPGVGQLSEELKQRNIDKPYIITEFGVTGEWDIKEEKYGIKIEPTDQQKYDAIAIGYHDWIKPKPACLGVYVFHYGDGNDFGSPWLLTHHQGNYRPQYWAIREAYTGETPVNKVPVIESFTLLEGEQESGSWIPVSLKLLDSEAEELEVSFYYNQRTGSRKRKSQLNALNSRGSLAEGFEIQLPAETGAIKVYINAKDTYGNVGIASTALLLKTETANQRKYLVPKASLPFYVYKDGQELPYLPSGYMGNTAAMQVNTRNTIHAKSGDASLQIIYDSEQDWYGLALVDPADDWGETLGGYDLAGAQTFSFWARASSSKVRATIGFGLIDDDQPYPDTAKKSLEINMSTSWKKYTLDLDGLDLSCIRSGLVLFSGGMGTPHKIYLDDVMFE